MKETLDINEFSGLQYLILTQVVSHNCKEIYFFFAFLAADLCRVQNAMMPHNNVLYRSSLFRFSIRIENNVAIYRLEC